jgi:hypothetical protein
MPILSKEIFINSNEKARIRKYNANINNLASRLAIQKNVFATKDIQRQKIKIVIYLNPNFVYSFNAIFNCKDFLYIKLLHIMYKNIFFP